MKKILYLAFLLPALFACSKENPDGGADSQTVTCVIETPEDGTELDLSVSSELTVKGNATVSNGAIAKVEFKIGDATISEVTSVPFEYKHVFSAEQQPGEVTLVLKVTGDEGAEASDEVKLVLKRSEEVPQPDEGEFLDPRDNHIYKTVTIGEQTWMAENLAYLPVVNKPETAALDDGKQYYYVLNYDGEDVAAAKNTEEYKTYGVLYNWFAAVGADNAEGVPVDAVPSGVQGPCPDGWHLPGEAEWKVLSDFVASELEPVKGNGTYIDLGIPGEDPYWEFEEGLKNVWSALAGKEGWGQSANTDSNPDLAAGPRDLYGFNAIPAGQCYHTGTYGFSESSTSFWTPHTLEQGGSSVDFSNLNYALGFAKYGTKKNRAYSVRCIKD